MNDKVRGKNQNADRKRLRVLLVEDDPSLRELLCDSFERHEFEILEAANGKEGFEAFVRRHVDVVVTDYQMPEMNGSELSHRIKAIDPVFPIVLVTGDAPDQVILELGRFENFLTLMKPFATEALIHALKQVLAQPLSGGRIDTRKSTRVDTSIDCEIQAGGSQGMSTGVVRNLSFGGCYIEAVTADFQKIESSIGFRLRGSDHLIRGRVAWARPSSGQAQGGIGVCFSQDSVDTEEFLRDFILNQLKLCGVAIR